MRFTWDTNSIAGDLGKISFVRKVKISPPSGDYDTSTLEVLISGTGYALYISGYLSTDTPMSNPDLTPIRWVAITDGLSSRGGLNSDNINVAHVYMKVRQYFVDNGVEVINHYDEIF